MAINTEDPDNIITLHASSEDNVNSSNVVIKCPEFFVLMNLFLS